MDTVRLPSIVKATLAPDDSTARMEGTASQWSTDAAPVGAKLQRDLLHQPILCSGDEQKDVHISRHIILLHLVRSVWTVSLYLRYAHVLIVTTSVSNRD